MRSALFARSGGEVHSTGDGFFVAFYRSSVRIGLHATDANRRGDDYSGMGVHVAARVAALAGGGEIVVTTGMLAEADGIRTSEPSEASLKGVSDPVNVVSVIWDSV